MKSYCNFTKREKFINQYKHWIYYALANGDYITKDQRFTESIAVGGNKFLEDMKLKLGINAKGRKITENNGLNALREPKNTYEDHFIAENDVLSYENAFDWNAFDDISIS